MKTVSMTIYNNDKCNFFEEHYGENGFREKSSVDGEEIYKTYAFEDGAVWYEITRPVYENALVTLHGIEQIMTLKFYLTEMWDTDNSSTRYLYEAT